MRIRSDATVGSITVAENAGGFMTQPIRANTSIGQALPIGSVTRPFQQIFLRSMASCGTMLSCPEGIMPSPLADDTMCQRLQTLYHQESWVAKDEIEFYLNMIACSCNARVGPILAMPEFLDEEEVEPILQRWLCNCAPADSEPGIIITVLWVANH